MVENISSLVNSFKKHFNSPYMLLMKYNPMGINSGLCSLDKISFLSQKSQIEKKHKKFYGHSPEFLSIELNNLVVSWGQVCDNPLVRRVWGQILSKNNNLCFQVIYFLFVFCANLVLSLLLHTQQNPTELTRGQPQLQEATKSQIV